MTNTDEYYSIHQVRFEIVLSEVEKLHLNKDARILDVGCFPLYLFNKLKKRGYDMHGIASHHEPVTNKKIQQLNIEKEKLPYENDYFDLVLVSEVIEHLTANPAVYMTEFHRVLVKNGKLLITTPNAAHLKNRTKLVFGKSPSFSLDQLEETNIEDDTIYHRHNREFTKEELEHILHDSSFKIHDSKYVSFYTPNRKNRESSLVQKVGYGITKAVPALRDSLLVVANK